MEHEMAVEHHNDDAYRRHHRSHNLQTVQPLGTIEHRDEQGCKQRTETDYQRRVGCSGIDHSGVLRQEIERAARHAQCHHQQFVLP